MSEAEIQVIISEMENGSISESEFQQVQVYNNQGYLDHVAGASSAVITAFTLKYSVTKGRFRILAPPLAGLSFAAGHIMMCNWRAKKLISDITSSSDSRLSRKIKKLQIRGVMNLSNESIS